MAEILTPTAGSPTTPDTLRSVTALARFEFEPGQGNNGTKILMVEWQDDDQTRQKTGSWHVSWSGKKTVFPADDDVAQNIRRVFFMLPPHVMVPPHVVLAYEPPRDSSKSEPEALRMTVNPLPAIFTPELGATARTSGAKGVLHTIWGKKRIQMLEQEIRFETEHNVEGVALEMAIAEKRWIEDTFGLQQKPLTLDLKSLGANQDPIFKSTPLTPRSPGGGRLSEKLKGLSLGTTEKDLGIRNVNTALREEHPLSPETSDLAYSSFSSFQTGPASTASDLPRKIIATSPPKYIKDQQHTSLGSLNSIAQAPSSFPEPSPVNFKQPVKADTAVDSQQEPNDDDLFAVALSPRSPDIPKSPFSISSAEVGAFSKIKGEQ